MDIPLFEKKVAEASAYIEPELLNKEFGDSGDARKLFDDARKDGIVFLDEGTHHFRLQNGAALTVYASPYTASLGDGGFQFRRQDGHDFTIGEGVDIVITHGPPAGVLDMTDSRQRGGSSDLFAAVARSRPRLHCFGHIHEGWGAKLVTWRGDTHALDERPSHFSNIDNGQSTVVETLSSLRAGKFDTAETAAEKEKNLRHYTTEGCRTTSHCDGDSNPLRAGLQTLFINAAIQSLREGATQLPWIVDVDLPKAE